MCWSLTYPNVFLLVSSGPSSQHLPFIFAVREWKLKLQVPGLTLPLPALHTLLPLHLSVFSSSFYLSLPVVPYISTSHQFPFHFSTPLYHSTSPLSCVPPFLPPPCRPPLPPPSNAAPKHRSIVTSQREKIEGVCFGN